MSSPGTGNGADEMGPGNVIPILWQVAEQTVRGASHERLGTPNQDAIGSHSGLAGDQPFTILAVSDGHGSSKCFRSDVGAHVAVSAAISVLSDFIQRTVDTGLSESTLADGFCNAWDAAVADHLSSHPLTQDELDGLTQKEGASAAQLLDNDPTIAYGATVLAVAAVGTSLIFLQLGDGDILCVDHCGDTSRAFPKDEKLIANETTSLCTQDASRHVQIRTLDSRSEGVELVLVSSDGYSNSFRTEQDFTAIGSDYLKMIRQSGLAWVSDELQRILENTSRQGSGDDISLGILKLAVDTDIDAVTQRLLRLETCAELAASKADVAELRQRLDDRETADAQRTKSKRLAANRTCSVGLAVIAVALVVWFVLNR